MVYITGDTHGELDRFREGELRRAGKQDVVIVLGDFGFVWDGSAEEQKRLDWLRARPYTLIFLDGSHENYDLLEKYPLGEKYCARVHELGGNLCHVCRGGVLEIEGKSYLCFGGTESPDREERLPGENWWAREAPSDEEYAWCEENLARRGYHIDYVLTHDAPSKFLNFGQLAMGESSRVNSFLDSVAVRTTYEQWLFGCYHKDVRLSTKSRCLFCDVVKIGEKRSRWPFGKK